VISLSGRRVQKYGVSTYLDGILVELLDRTFAQRIGLT